VIPKMEVVPAFCYLSTKLHGITFQKTNVNAHCHELKCHIDMKHTATMLANEFC
jgi:hypothetical protein